LEVLHEVVPKAAVIAVLLNPKLSTATFQLEDMQVAARALGLQIHVFHARTEREIDIVFASLIQVQVGGLVIGADAFFFSSGCRESDILALRLWGSIGRVSSEIRYWSSRVPPTKPVHPQLTDLWLRFK
jgi:putative ABC transport system substrate-binding protein